MSATSTQPTLDLSPDVETTLSGHVRERKRRPARSMTSFELAPAQRMAVDEVRMERGGMKLADAIREALDEWCERHGKPLPEESAPR